MRKKTIFKFRQDIEKKVGYFNAPMGFWFRTFYEKYLNGVMTYEDAIDTMAKMKLYTGA